jgi:DNA-binding response OmpR family regulator
MPRILIIDDDADFREACRLPLEEVGFEVSEANDADAGFQKVRSERPDLVVLDVLMPSEYEGFDLARRIREEIKLLDLPILMLSAVHERKKPPYRFAPDEVYLPVDEFLDKPVPSDALVRKIQEMLGLHREEPEEPL